MTTTPTASDSTSELLASVRADGEVIAAREVHRLHTIREWALAHTITGSADAAASLFAGDEATGLSLAGPGAPQVSEWALVELCAALGRSTDSGRAWVSRVLELAFRLPRLWERVKDQQVLVWRALAIAERTLSLSVEATGYVDRRLAPFAHSCSWAQADRLVEEALVRFDPVTADQKRREAAEHRHFDIDTDQVSYDGTVQVHGELDLADGLDLDAALSRRATQFAELGCSESLDVRRSLAAGELARADLTLDLPTPTAQKNAKPRPGRRVELVVHLTDAALAGRDPIARCATTQTPISSEQVRQWCGQPDTRVIVRPVLDLAEHHQADSYEIPNRTRRQVTLRDPHCVFPWCQRRAERCDLDHRVPYDSGGITCQCNVAPLCRRHHRAKTFAGWTYTTLDPGTYVWVSPAGYHYQVDAHGTTDLDRASPPPAPV